MDITLNILFLNDDNIQENLIINTKKDIVIKQSEYFKGLFSNVYKDSTEKTISIDLTQFKYNLSKGILQIFFDIMLDPSYTFKRIKGNTKIKTLMDTDLQETKFTYTHKINLGLTDLIHIDQLYQIIQLSDYFHSEFINNLISNTINNYCSLINELNNKYKIAYNGKPYIKSTINSYFSNDDEEEEPVYKYKLPSKMGKKFTQTKVAKKSLAKTKSKVIVYEEEDEEKKPVFLDDDIEDELEEEIIVEESTSMIETINDEFILEMDTLSAIDPSDLRNDISISNCITIINDFLVNIYQIFLGFKLSNNSDKFNELVKQVEKIISVIKNIKQTYIRIELSSIHISKDEIHNIPLNDYYNLLNCVGNVINVEKELLKVYDFYDIMLYDEHEYDMFKYNGTNYKYQINKQTIKSKDNFIKTFSEKTNNMFDHIEWNNMIISGGFIYGLIDDLTNSMINSTDIDIFVIGNQEEVQYKVQYLLEYFNTYGPFYIKRGKVITILIPSFGYDIQIIPTDKTTGEEVINNFDLSYVSLYYDGTDIYTNIDGLMSLKYKLAIYNNKLVRNEDRKLVNPVSDMRIYKTYLKGVNILHEKSFDNECISDDQIDTQILEKSNKQLIKKPLLVRKLLLQLDNVADMIYLIKLYYKSRYVDTIMDQINKTTDYTSNEYDSLTKITKVNLDNIKKLKETKVKGELIRYSLITNDDREIKKLTIEIDYSNYKFTMNEHDAKLILEINHDIEVKLDKIAKLLTNHIVTKRKLKIYTYKNGDDDKSFIHVHIDKKNMNKYKEITDKLSSYDPENTNIKVIASGKLWYAKDTESRGIKFVLDSYKIREHKYII
ncbi:BTB/POZ domain-containing protein [Fadolivirus algeromassiliense]|jgi:hypothetical protein|uniref:BTB/POZ domain-containing protein n=1 Tax=Fadolivirus FV1/VV64 TaxID=3070911 RepID=A0A7D3R1Q1_9VIRU|nr:BTB/POZ domain-containing protein [Fadolivirus algeromassiliense]QKF94682.1 BTB/POZ domain-containing protein [Fadolivirus FV1/VV64]